MPRTKLIHERLTHSVIGAFFEVYHTLGFGFLEHVYIASLTRELNDSGHEVAREVDLELGLLLHFGPQPKFYRVICTNPVERAPKNSLPRVPPPPRVPRKVFVVVAGDNEPQA